jgi:hypothetical protein
VALMAERLWGRRSIIIFKNRIQIERYPSFFDRIGRQGLLVSSYQEKKKKE